MTRIVLENVTKYFRGKGNVLDDVSFKIESGDFAAILGPENAGKTTMLRIIAGVEKPDSGKIYFGGEDVTDLPPQRRNVGMTYQTFALYPNLTVYENIASPLRVRDISKDEIDIRVRETAEMLQISPLVDNLPSELSGGESQRVALARALVKDTTVYMLDEPLTNLDYKLRESMRFELKRILEEKKATILYATPDPEEAIALANSLIFLYEGKVQQMGPVEDCYAAPANITAGKYYNKPPMNMIDADLVRKNGSSFFVLGEIELDVTHLGLPIQESEYVLGLAPQNLYLTEEKEGMLAINTALELQEISGSEMVVMMDWDGSFLHMYVPYTKVLRTKSLKIFIDPSDFFIFSRKTGELITKYKVV